MLASVEHRRWIRPSAPSPSPVAAMSVDECETDVCGVALPRSEVHLVVRFGSATRRGVDVHAFGARQRVHRKFIRKGQRTVTARLHLGAHEPVLGVPASELSQRIVAIEDLWGDAAASRLFDQLANTQGTRDAAEILQSAIAERVVRAPNRRSAPIALDAARRLSHGNVTAVAAALGVSERHLRRVFHDAFGVSPKGFAQLLRFRQALSLAHADARINWASVASAAGYYDQAHLIADFRAVAGVTPRALMTELATAFSIG